MQYLTLFSVDTSLPTRRVFALVPEMPNKALHRLREDDPLWRHPSVYQHWCHAVDVEKTRVRVRNRLKIWLAKPA